MRRPLYGMGRLMRRGTMKTTRLRKVHCPTCGCIARMSRAALIHPGPPECACGAGTMGCADPADAIECGLMALDDLSRPELTKVCRANGWDDSIIRTSRSQEPGRRTAIRIRTVSEMPF